MSERVSVLDHDAHDKVQQLLPSLVSERLEGEELRFVTEHLETCALCKQDIVWQRKLRETEPIMTADLRPDRAWQNLQARLETKAIAPERDRTRQQSWRTVWQQYQKRFWQGLVLVQFAAIAILLLTEQPQTAPQYVTLSAQAPITARFIVVFKPETRVNEIADVLRPIHARITDGPTITDGYLINVSGISDTKAIDYLRSDPHVALVQALTGDGKR